MRQRIILASLFLATSPLFAQRYAQPPDVPASAPASDFPLHVRILNVHWNRVNGGYEGYGRADLLGPPLQGIDYTFSCSEPFLHNAARGEFYQARWKKQDQKLEILMQKVGSDHLQKCELKTAVKSQPYGRYGTAAAPPPADAVPPASSAPPQ